MKFRLESLAIIGLLFFAFAGKPAVAHHSFAMFDTSKQLTITGTVKQLEWTNPHVWLWVTVDDGNGNLTDWALEGAAPGELIRTGGWTKHSVSPGEKVTVQLAPLKDGRPGGSLGKVTLANGTVIGTNRFQTAPASSSAPTPSP